jgi:hypothetical protein
VFASHQKEACMTYHRVLTVVTTTLLSVIALGCAGPTTDSSSRLADATASSSPVSSLCGTWSGSWNVSQEFTSQNGNVLTLQIGGDSTYTFKWGNRSPITGKVAFQGNRVILQDVAGSDITLARRSGDTLYGLTRDSANGRPTMMSLEKQESVGGPFAASGPGCS